ncbi:MAG: NUDIX hydrolase [Xanthobacteraceae bacterium]
MDDVRAVAVERLELRLAPRAWGFSAERRADIDAYFAAIKRAQPALWNGRVMLLYQWALVDGRFTGAYFDTDFASMIAWRDWGFPDPLVRNCFAQGALRSADGAFLLGVMGAHTANAGKIYFPSGTPDLDDVIGDAVDLDGSVMRELTEETGLGAGDVRPASGWHAVFAGPRIGMMKILQSAEPATALRTRILAFLAQQATPELVDVRIVRSSADYDPMMPSFITTFLDEIWK